MSYDTEQRLSAAMRNAAGDRPYAPDVDRIEGRGKQLRRRRLAWGATGGGAFAIAAVAAVAVTVTGGGVQAPAPNLAKPAATSGAATAAAEEAPMVQLVSYLTTAPQPTGDATLLLRSQVQSDGSKIDVWDLHADNGDYYFAKNRGALPAQVAGKKLQGETDGRRKVVAAAKAAATGDLNDARAKMALAYMPANPKVEPTIEAPGARHTLPAEVAKIKGVPGGVVGNTTDNWVWNNSMDALIVGAGDPVVRAGVLRLLGQMPDVAVKEGTFKGQAVFTLTAGKIITGGPETLTINAETGLPIKFTSGGTTNYTVTRVTIDDVRQGEF
ncbi:hypothetical protein Ait01nite_096730 [Actinoplanes italicus]|uniref:Uncharacterized protein n=1 Tax=Actinoplanes italicus TaxID=113567 RepID=A0A2T0KBA3_9ACTN|nr:hypothetical protein [Actinoplanes italicus]PRX20444.1 hypothetical protein CLV67_108242 [Actinoplanes italicus]GIE36628.1 hypothetical protein Ait01nite_096730 [Actinoplanes italicus]